jgi:hypothetical protein
MSEKKQAHLASITGTERLGRNGNFFYRGFGCRFPEGSVSCVAAKDGICDHINSKLHAQILR